MRSIVKMIKKILHEVFDYNQKINILSSEELQPMLSLIIDKFLKLHPDARLSLISSRDRYKNDVLYRKDILKILEPITAVKPKQIIAVLSYGLANRVLLDLLTGLEKDDYVKPPLTVPFESRHHSKIASHIFPRRFVT